LYEASNTEEPGARKPHAGNCEGAVGQPAVLPRLHDNMNDKLSSSSTYYYKVLLPAVWIIMFGFVTIEIWLGLFDQQSPVAEEGKFLFLVAWIIGFAFMLRYTVCLKTVSLDKDDLVIKNFNRVIRVPLSNINHISESRLWRPKTISLTVYPPCEFGEKITFIPRISLKSFFLKQLWEDHPVVERLRQMTGVLK